VAHGKKLSVELTALQLEFVLPGPGWASTFEFDQSRPSIKVGGCPVLSGAPLKKDNPKSYPMKTSVLAIALVLTSHFANAAFVYHDSATTNGGEFVAGSVVFGIGNLKDSGHDSHLDTENTATNGVSYATTSVNSPTNRFPVTITLDFTQAVDLSKFYLWNHSNSNGSGAPANGVKDFSLTFFDGASGGGTQIGSVFNGLALAAPGIGSVDYAAQVFDFGSTYADVRSIRFLITSKQSGLTTGFVAVREIGFEAIPEPSSAFLGGLGLLALLRRRR
jgi:hypothetical protein